MSGEDDGQAAAEAFRQEHALGLQPLGDLIAVIESTVNVDVAVVAADPDEHGLTMHDPVRDVTFVAVARTPHPMRQRSTLAHELAHVLFRDWQHPATLGVRGTAEVRADAFARHLLVPGEALEEAASSRVVDEGLLSTVVQRFLVSPPLAAIAMHQAGLIDQATKRSWMNLSSPKLATLYGWADQYRSLSRESQQLRAPQHLLARAVQGYAHGVVTAQTIARLRGVSSQEVESELTEAGISPIDDRVAWADPMDLPDVDPNDLPDGFGTHG